jgi:hypothetical protein
VSKLIDLLCELPLVQVNRVFPDEIDRPVPRVKLILDEANLGFNARELVGLLKENDPSVRTQEFLLDEGILLLNPLGLLEGDEEIIYEAFKEIWLSRGLM